MRDLGDGCAGRGRIARVPFGRCRSGKELCMETRTTRKQVTFAKPFRLMGMEEVQPSGTYTLTLEEQSLEALCFIGWRQVNATLALRRGGATEYFPIDMQDLREALLRDTDQSTDPPAAPVVAAGRIPYMRKLSGLQSRQSL